MKKRIKITLKPITTRAEAGQVMADLALAENETRYQIAHRDAAILEVNERFAPRLTLLEDEVNEHTLRLKEWAGVHPEEFPKNRKSIEFATGLLGFRTGTPKLSLLSKAFGWDKVLEAIRTKRFAFIRTKEEVDKDAILAFASNPKDAADAEAITEQVLRPIGVKVVQDEGFFIEPKLTDTTCTQTA